MGILNKLRKLFLYAGIEKDEYQQLLPVIHEKNRELLKVLSLIGSVMFFILLIASLLTGGFASSNTTTYLMCGIGMLIILACAWMILPKYPALVTLLACLFEILLYVFGIRISLLHAEKAAVSAVAFLLVCPLLFYDRPVYQSALTAAVVAVFCAVVLRFKEADVAETDIWNMITFGVVAVFSTIFMMTIKIQALLQSGQIEYMSQTDLLTGAKNRNHFENRLHAYPSLCTLNLACIYADVNGLHEMNNREGHPAGDQMLREVAAAMQRRFGAEHTYRVGGDEFVAFRADGRPESLAEEIEQLRQELSGKGYHVSFGTAAREKKQGQMDMRLMVTEAESSMFADKREYYRRSENDRMSR